MTDKPSCFAAHQDYENVQLSISGVYIDMSRRGGLKAYEYRVNDLPLTDMQLASRFQKNTNILILGGPQTGGAAAMMADRLRIRVLTVLGEAPVYDIDMRSSGEVLKMFVGAQCS